MRGPKITGPGRRHHAEDTTLNDMGKNLLLWLIIAAVLLTVFQNFNVRPESDEIEVLKHRQQHCGDDQPEQQVFSHICQRFTLRGVAPN